MIRRIFLKKLAVALYAATWSGTAIARTPEGVREKRRISDSKIMMGTNVTIFSYHASLDFVRECHELMFERADTMISIFSRHDIHSALSYLNDAKTMRSAPPELLTVLARSIHYHRISAGAFDVRVLPMLALLEQKLSISQLEKLLQDIELAQQGTITVHDGDVRLSASTSITLDGIAKGYIVDGMLALARELGLKHCLVNAGGDIGCFGGVPGNAPWQISLYNPDGRRLEPEPILLTAGAVATSGSYFKPLGDTYHHILDPLRRISPWHHTSVSVVAESVLEADAMATTCMVLDTADAQALLAKNCMRGIFVCHDGARS